MKATVNLADSRPNPNSLKKQMFLTDIKKNYDISETLKKHLLLRGINAISSQKELGTVYLNIRLFPLFLLKPENEINRETS